MTSLYKTDEVDLSASHSYVSNSRVVGFLYEYTGCGLSSNDVHSCVAIHRIKQKCQGVRG